MPSHPAVLLVFFAELSGLIGPTACHGAGSGRATLGDCALGIAPATVADAMRVRVTRMAGVAGDAQSCDAETDGAVLVHVSVRPRAGLATLRSWTGGRMPLRAESVAGIGDSAVWQSELREMIAEQNDVLCDVSVTGAPDRADDGAWRARAGALCNAVFEPFRQTGNGGVQPSRR